MSQAKTHSTASTTPTPPPLTANRILRRPEVQELTGLCTSAIYTGMKRGTFPRSVQLGPRAVGWRAQDIAAYLEHGVAGVRNDNK
ncbi:MAG: AlpA family phage regulatory protein [Desulfovibrio sp.]|nr:AlpA family phage regulatory protein [Desulfovibrio sp.]